MKGLTLKSLKKWNGQAEGVDNFLTTKSRDSVRNYRKGIKDGHHLASKLFLNSEFRPLAELVPAGTHRT